MKRSYMISENYCRDWKPVAAIREVMANAYDSGDEVKLSFSNGVGEVHNTKTFLEKKFLLLGESNSREKTDTIGQWGEGFKIAALVTCREGRSFAIRSGRNLYKYSAEIDPTFNSTKQLTVEINDTDLEDKVPGTKCFFDCSEQEFNEARDLFIVNSPERVIEGSILGDCPGAIYVSGVKVAEDYETAFGYNFNNKTMINRDRNIIDKTKITELISKALSETKSTEVIECYLIAAQLQPKLEHTFYFYPQNKDVWKAVVHQKYGDKICLPYAEHSDKLAEKLGYRIVNFGNYPNGVIRNATDVKNSHEIVTNIAPSALEKTAQEFEWIKKAKYYLLKFGIVVGEVYVYDDPGAFNDAEIRGEIIYLNRDQNDTFPKIYKNIIYQSAVIEASKPTNPLNTTQQLCEYFERIADKLWNK